MPRIFGFNRRGTGAEFAFSVIQTDAGTSPTADSASDTLTLTSSDGSVLITGSSLNDSVNFSVQGTSVGGFTQGSVIFADSSGTLAQDNAALFFDDTNDFLTLGHNTPAARLHIAGNISTGTAWGVNGIILRIDPSTVTDTVSSGTVSQAMTNAFGIPTLAASSATTYTNASNLYVRGAPAAGTNVTITAAWALDVNGTALMRTTLGVGNNIQGNAPRANFTISGDLSSTVAHSVFGQRLRVTSRTYTDTVSSGTVTSASIDGFATATIAASSATTYTNYSTVYIANTPTAGSNVTITNPLALWVDAGNTRLDGFLSVGSGAAPEAALDIDGVGISAAAWTTNGIKIRARSATYTDTTSSGTVPAVAISGFAAGTLAASSATTYTNAASIYIASGPSAGSNVTITNGWALYVAAGNVHLLDQLWVGKRFLEAEVALTDAATIATDASLGNVFTVTLGGNRTMGAPTNAPTKPQKIVYRIKQDATGSRTITWNAAFRFSGGTAPTLTTTASKTDYVGFIYNVADSVWDNVTGAALNF